MKTFKQYLVEYVTNPLIKLRDYLQSQRTKSEKELNLDLAKEYWNYRKIYDPYEKSSDDSIEDLIVYYLMNEVSISDYYDDEIKMRDQEIHQEMDDGNYDNEDELYQRENDYLEKFSDINNAPDELKLDFGEWIYDLLSDKEHREELNMQNDSKCLIKIDDQPAWEWMTFERFYQNTWNIHFTGIGDSTTDDRGNENVEAIARDGFKYGTNLDEMKGVWISGWKYLEDKELLPEGGYVFGYALDDFMDSRLVRDIHAPFVMFQASGMEVYHRGDGEHQCIFLSNTIRNLIPVFVTENDQYYIRDKNNEEKIYWQGKEGEDNLQQIENLNHWIEKSFVQYKNRIVWRVRND